MRGAGAVFDEESRGVNLKSSRARRRRQSRAANPWYASRAVWHCNFRNNACTASVLRGKIVHLLGPQLRREGTSVLCTVCLLACPRIRNPETPKRRSPVRFRRFLCLRSKGELLCRPPLDCTDLRPSLYRSVILSGEQGLARFLIHSVRARSEADERYERDTKSPPSPCRRHRTRIEWTATRDAALLVRIRPWKSASLTPGLSLFSFFFSSLSRSYVRCNRRFDCCRT